MAKPSGEYMPQEPEKLCGYIGDGVAPELDFVTITSWQSSRNNIATSCLIFVRVIYHLLQLLNDTCWALALKFSYDASVR